MVTFPFHEWNKTSYCCIILKYHDLFDLFCANDYTKQHENIKNDISKQINLSLLVEHSTSFQSGKSLLCVSRGYS